MNDGSRPMELHYMNPGFPYTATESFMEFFDGPPVDYDHAGPIPYQEYWSMNTNPYKFGLSGPDSASYYGSYEENNSFPRLEVDRGEWEYPLTMTTEEPTTTDSPSRRDGVNGLQTISEESSPNRRDSSNAPVIWEDNIDPDNMTYEELLDLGEAVGTQSRGLPQELIDLLPTSKFNFGSLFKRKNFGKRCVICQMTYRRGDQQMKLPCRHVYHGECITKWLSINKKCPVCNVEPLTPQEEQALKETLQAIIEARKTVHLQQKIDPSILGGLVVEFNQKVLDMSIKTRALEMERFLREPMNFTDI